MQYYKLVVYDMVAYKLVIIITSSKNLIEEYPQDSESMEDSVSLWMANIITAILLSLLFWRKG